MGTPPLPPKTLSENISPLMEGCTRIWWTTIVGGYIGGEGSEGQAKSAKTKSEHINTETESWGIKGSYRGLQ